MIPCISYCTNFSLAGFQVNSILVNKPVEPENAESKYVPSNSGVDTKKCAKGKNMEEGQEPCGHKPPEKFSDYLLTHEGDKTTITKMVRKQ